VRRLAVVGIVLVALLPLVSGGASATPSRCADVLYLGARGSGQPAGGSSADGESGMGPQVHASYQRLVSDLPGRRVTGMAVDYPALRAELLFADPASYFSGLERGVRSVRRTLREQTRLCPSQRIVLSGFSQGAMVMHRAIQDLITLADASSRDILRHVAGVILLADGDRLKGDRTTDFGSAESGRGISYALTAESGARGTRLPSRFRPRVFSVCEAADVICDHRSLLQANGAGVDGFTIHTTQYNGSRNVLAATDAAAARVRAS
jgi:hypothetical protein